MTLPDERIREIIKEEFDSCAGGIFTQRGGAVVAERIVKRALSESRDAEIERLKARVEDLESGVSEANDRWLKARARAEKAEQEVARLQAENATLKHDEELLKMSNKSLCGELCRLQAEVARAARHWKILEDQVCKGDNGLEHFIVTSADDIARLARELEEANEAIRRADIFSTWPPDHAQEAYKGWSKMPAVQRALHPTRTPERGEEE